MKISQNCLSVIKKWEGFHLDAYSDPVGIPTIGYGSRRYPNGQKILLGDKITEQEAEAFLKFECDKVAEEISKLVTGISLNQNQFDALVSFSYNVGIGAFADSTLLKKLKTNDFPGAAKEFERWVKGTKNGVQTTLPGLVDRRKSERSLFEKSDEQGTPIEVEDSPQDKVTLLEGYRDGEKNVIVAWGGSEVIEILTLETFIKDDFIAVLQQYKNAKEFRIAPTNKAIPQGKSISVSGKGQPISQVNNPPILNRILVRGSEGDDVKELQRRLNDIGYDGGKVDGSFGKKTEEAMKSFQADYFGLAEADGRVGPRTWEKLWGDLSPAKSAPTESTAAKAEPTAPTPTSPASGKNYLRLTKTQSKDPFGCYKLKFEYFKDGQLKDSLEVCSGSPSRQLFRKGNESVAGSYEPLPEGKWYIGNISWAGGADNYEGPIHQSGIGPVSVPLRYVEPGQTQRSGIEIHIDWNRQSSAGTAGCIGMYTTADYKRFVSWLRETDPRDLFVDWGLGTCPAV
ncbi:glycoside hydrolase family protein [Allocoleopsis sp.]|uniref:glycoside hydrolase family protein n=1 Tax=Allocoleopsis sp. TaxID=3088169 RepID=UPI002FD61DE6